MENAIQTAKLWLQNVKLENKSKIPLIVLNKGARDVPNYASPFKSKVILNEGRQQQRISTLGSNDLTSIHCITFGLCCFLFNFFFASLYFGSLLLTMRRFSNVRKSLRI